MDGINYNLTWNEIYIMIDSRRYYDIDYLDLKFSIINNGTDYLHGYTDWIEKESLYDENIIKNIFDVYIKSKRRRGKTKTAEMLWVYKDDKEKIALVLLGMYIRQVINNYPIDWGLNTHKIYVELWKILFMRMKELNMQSWYSQVTKPMPFSLFLKKSFYSIKNPKNLEDIFNLFTLEINYIFNKYQLIKCVDPRYEERKLDLFDITKIRQ